MAYNFDSFVDRSDCGSFKQSKNTPENIREGIPAFFGAEVDYPNAPCIIDALVKKASSGTWGYTYADDKYYEAVIWWLKNSRNMTVEREWIVPTHGTIYSMMTVIRAFSQPGDGVIIQPPVYPGYSKTILDQGRTVLENTMINDDGVYSMDFENLENLMAKPSAKIMIICNPQNPLARIHSEEELTKIACLAVKYDILLVCDEVFGDVTPKRYAAIPLCKIPQAKDISFVSVSIGKNFCIQGGSHANYIIANPKLRGKFIAQRNLDFFSGVEGYAYTAMVAAYTPQGLAWLDAQNEYISENAQLVTNFFNDKMPRVKVSPHQAGFMLWVDWHGIDSDLSRIKQMLTEAQLIMDWGDAYYSGSAACTRFIIGTPRAKLADALDRLYITAKKYNYVK